MDCGSASGGGRLSLLAFVHIRACRFYSYFFSTLPNNTQTM